MGGVHELARPGRFSSLLVPASSCGIQPVLGKGGPLCLELCALVWLWSHCCQGRLPSAVTKACRIGRCASPRCGHLPGPSPQEHVCRTGGAVVRVSLVFAMSSDPGRNAVTVGKTDTAPSPSCECLADPEPFVLQPPWEAGTVRSPFSEETQTRRGRRTAESLPGSGGAGV